MSNKHPGRTGLLHLGLGLACALQGVTIWVALRDMVPGGIESLVIPTVAALVVSIAFFFAWRYLIDHGSRSSDPYKRTGYIAIGLMLFGISVGATSWFMTSALAGDRAVRHHMNLYLAKATEQLSVDSANIDKESKIGPMLAKTAAKWRMLAEAERGGQHGKKGNGPIANAMDRSAAAAQQAQGDADNRIEEAKGFRDQANAVLREMTLLANDSSMGTSKGQQKFVEMTVRFSKASTDLENVTLTDLVDYIGIVTQEAKNSEVLRVAIEQTTTELHNYAKAVKDSKAKAERAVYMPVTKAAAVTEYADVAANGWVVAIALDSLPFLLLCLIMLTLGDKTNRHNDDDDLPGTRAPVEKPHLVAAAE
jgi:hypothetical protein